MIFVTYDFYLVISLLQSTLYKMETFGDGTKCLSYRETNEASKERRWPTLGVCFTEVFVLQGVRQVRVDYWWFSLSCNQNLTWKPFNTESLWIYKKPCQESGLCNISFARYSEKRFTQIYIALCGVAMLCVPFRGTNITVGNQQKRLFLSFPTNAWVLCLRNS